jgi:hypothetical protein
MITINLDKAKSIAHDKRRTARAEEFAPLDEAIAKQVPGMDAVVAEAGRQLIRDKYTAMQDAIDAATSADELKVALGL